MSQPNSPSKNSQNQISSEVEVDVLYQKLGDRWYAFSIVNDEVFMSPVSDDQIHSVKTENADTPIETSAETEFLDENF